MFEEGHRRQMRGQDVVIGSTQSSGMEDVAEKMSALEIVNQGVLDPGAVIRRKPEVCIVDELAYDNPPGSRNADRWQDVADLLAAGISVITALNLQHIAEKQDEIEKVTGKRAKVSVPEKFVRGAEELVVVDAPSDQLTTQQSDLSPEVRRLLQLREMSLLLAAEVVEAQLQRYMDAHGMNQSWGTQERILVCITPRSPAKHMVESGRRN